MQMMRADADVFARECTATNEPAEFYILNSYGGESAASFVQSIQRPYEAASSQIAEIPGVGKLKKPLTILVERADGGYVVRCVDLDITEAGATLAEALEAFCSFFREDAQHWKGTDNSQITAEALVLKGWYQEYIG